MEQVEEICDHIVLVNKGQKLLDGSVDKIKQDFKQNVYSVELAESVPLPADTETYEIVSNKGSKYHFKIKDGHNSNEILDYLIDQKIQIKSFNEVLPSLNDIFIQLVESTPASRQFETA